jgi:hypothetical protein
MYVVDVGQLVLQWHDRTQPVFVKEGPECFQMIQEHAEYLLEPWVLILWIELSPVVQKSVPLNLNDTVAVLMDEPHAWKWRNLRELRLLVGSFTERLDDGDNRWGFLARRVVLSEALPEKTDVRSQEVVQRLEQDPADDLVYRRVVVLRELTVRHTHPPDYDLETPRRNRALSRVIA